MVLEDIMSYSNVFVIGPLILVRYSTNQCRFCLPSGQRAQISWRELSASLYARVGL